MPYSYSDLKSFQDNEIQFKILLGPKNVKCKIKIYFWYLRNLCRRWWKYGCHIFLSWDKSLGTRTCTRKGFEGGENGAGIGTVPWVLGILDSPDLRLNFCGHCWKVILNFCADQTLRLWLKFQHVGRCSVRRRPYLSYGSLWSDPADSLLLCASFSLFALLDSADEWLI